jgi:hypothetical protein
MLRHPCGDQGLDQPGRKIVVPDFGDFGRTRGVFQHCAFGLTARPRDIAGRHGVTTTVPSVAVAWSRCSVIGMCYAIAAARHASEASATAVRAQWNLRQRIRKLLGTFGGMALG